QGRELHLLAYFVDPENADLAGALERVRSSRAERFREMVRRLQGIGVSIEDGLTGAPGGPESLGRRHLGELLGRQGRGRNPLPVEEALSLVRAAGGVAAWAHPAYDCSVAALRDLKARGLGAIEVEYPDTRRARIQELRGWAKDLDLAVTGGSDCHGPGRRAVG